MNLSVRIEIFKEDDVYTALSPELNVSSFGETIEEAKRSIKEAIVAFLEECRDMGTLDGILDEKILQLKPAMIRKWGQYRLGCVYI